MTKRKCKSDSSHWECIVIRTRMIMVSKEAQQVEIIIVVEIDHVIFLFIIDKLFVDAINSFSIV